MSEKCINEQTNIILNSIADGVFTVDKDWNITFFNDSAQRITGISKKEAIGSKCFDVFRASICQGSCALKQTIDSGKSIINLEIDILNRLGQKVPISISTSVLRNTKGELIGGVETFRDLSTVEILRKEITSKYTFQDIISKNHEIQKILDTLPDIAVSNSTVLIEGPSGCGKELFARAIHNLSGRQGRFVAINCAALPDTLLESEFFGYAKGAFSEAKKDKPGRFKLADTGSLFLDEIGDISTSLQMKLLRVLQEKEFEPLGATNTIKVDVRIIAATNKNLSQLVQEGKFRNDLFYRLNVVRVVLPSLSNRKEDIPILIAHFINKFNALKGKYIENISQEALERFMAYDFPGNIRELENFIEYTFIMCRGKTIEVNHLPKELEKEHFNNYAASLHHTTSPLDEAEVKAIKKALDLYGGNRQKTATHLGIEKTTLWRKMKKYGITYSS